MRTPWGSPSNRPFTDRAEAGRRLAAALTAQGATGPDDAGYDALIVLALPRGGVPVAAPIADELGCELDVVVARKIGLPWQPEFGVGAIAEDGPAIFNERALDEAGLDAEELIEHVERERAELGRRVAAYRGDRPPPAVTGRRVVLVDDGLATGITAVAAVRWLRQAGAGHVTVAAPVCSASAAAWLEDEADAVLALQVPSRFGAVGAFYSDFVQVTDDEVVALLDAARRRPA